MQEVEGKPRKRMGRPPKAPEKGRRQNYTFRLSDQTRDQLIEAASDSGRSLSEEIEWRIEESFREKQGEMLAKSLMNGSDNLYRLISKVSGLVSTIENYKDKSGSALGSRDWANHEPTRAAIRAGINLLVEDTTAPLTDFDVTEVHYKQQEIFERSKNTNKVSDDDKIKLKKYRELNNIHHMVLLAKVYAGILGGSISLRDLQSASLPPM